MYRREFKYQEFTNPDEIVEYFKTTKNCDVVNVVEFNGKWVAFYYHRINYWEETDDRMTQKDYEELFKDVDYNPFF